LESLAQGQLRVLIAVSDCDPLQTI